MYKIYHKITKRYLVGYSGNIRWTNKDNARIFKRKEDVRNFLRHCAGAEVGVLTDEHFDAIPPEWNVEMYNPVWIGSKRAAFVLIEGIK